MNTNLRTFYTIALTQVLSIIGSRISALALSIYVFTETQSATPIALVMFFIIVPQILLSGVGGALADRWNRRLLMLLADVGQAAGTILLLASFVSGTFEIWHLYVIVTIQSMFSAFQRPALQASITMLVPDEQRDRANAIQQMGGPIANIIAPAVAGLLFSAFGVVGAILIDLATFLIAVLVISRVSIPQPKQTAEGAMLKGSLFKESFYGLQYIWARKGLLGLVLFFAMINLLATGYSALETPYLLARTQDTSVLGILLSISSAGALIGGILYGVWGGTKSRIHTVMGAMMLAMLGLVLLGMSQTWWMLALSTLLLMTPLPMINAAAASIIQATVAPDVQGRVFAALQQISMLMMPIGMLAVGPLADHVFEPAVGGAGWARFAPFVGTSFGSGMGLLIMIAGGIAFVLTILAYSVPVIRNVEKSLADSVPTQPVPVSTPEVAVA
ncbi:MAG: MFS transporter [Chloroflexota bacterium]